jgi:hypothetical protein
MQDSRVQGLFKDMCYLFQARYSRDVVGKDQIFAWDGYEVSRTSRVAVFLRRIERIRGVSILNGGGCQTTNH